MVSSKAVCSERYFECSENMASNMLSCMKIASSAVKMAGQLLACRVEHQGYVVDGLNILSHICKHHYACNRCSSLLSETKIIEF